VDHALTEVEPDFLFSAVAGLKSPWGKRGVISSKAVSGQCPDCQRFRDGDAADQPRQSIPRPGRLSEGTGAASAGAASPGNRGGPYDNLTLLATVGAAKAYAAPGDAAHAVEYEARYEEGLEKNIELNMALGSEREKLTYLSSTSWQTDRTISLNIREAPDSPAARELAALVLLRKKGRVLDAMSSNCSALRQRLGAEDHKLLDELEASNSKLAKVALESGVSARSAEFRARSIPVTLPAVRAAIPPEAALIEFAIYFPFDPKGEPNMIPTAKHATRHTYYGPGMKWVPGSGAGKRDRHHLKGVPASPARRKTKGCAESGARRRRANHAAIRKLIGEAKQLLVSPDGAAPGSTGDAEAQRPAAPFLLGQLHSGRRVENSAR